MNHSWNLLHYQSITTHIVSFRKWSEGIPLLLMTLTERNQQKHPQTIFLHIPAKQMSNKIKYSLHNCTEDHISQSQHHTMARIPQRNMKITI
jgi:hypothetical protein